MISFGAVLGKTTPSQLVLMAIIESALFFINFEIGYHHLEVHDCGGGMIIHAFGAYFGLAVCWWFSWDACKNEDVHDNASTYTSDITSLIGTLFLWVLWPSFNAAVVGSAEGQYMAIVNTFISLCSSALAFAVVTRLVSGGKFDAVQLQNATLAGGVAMGVSGDLNIGLHSAVIGGFSAGAVSCLGYAYLTPMIEKAIGIQDVCGVHNLHGMPGIIAAFLSIIAAATREDKVTPQVLTLVCSLAIAIFGGLLTGALMRLLGTAAGIDEFAKKDGHRQFEDVFNDRAFWVSANDYDNVVKINGGGGGLTNVVCAPP